MARRKFTPKQQTISFKGPGSRLQISEQRLKQQADERIDAMKLAKLQKQEQDKSVLGDMSDNARFEEKVLSEKQRLEGAVRKHKFDAFKKYADTSVNKLLGIAEEKKKEADHWAQLAPKAAAAAGKLAKGLYDFSEYLEAQSLNDQAIDNGMFNLHDKEYSETRYKLYLDWLKEQDNIDVNDYITHDKFLNDFAGKDNQAFANKSLNDIKTNKATYQQNVQSYVTQVLGEKWTKDSAAKWYNWAGYEHLRHLGIKPSSRGGREILGVYRQWGSLERNRLINEDKVKKTQYQMEFISQDLDAETDPKMKIVLFNALTKITDRGTFKDVNTGTYSTGINNLAVSQQTAGEYYVTRFHDKFQSETEVREFFSNIPSVGDENLELPQTMGSRHPLRVDAIVNKWAAAKDTQKTLKNATNIAEDEANIETFENTIQTHNNKRDPNHPDYDPNYTVTTSELMVTEINKAINNTKGTNVSRNHVFKYYGLVEGQFDVAAHFADITDLYNKGDANKARIRFQSLTTKQQTLLRPEFETAEKVAKANYQFGGKFHEEALVAKAKDIHLQNEVSATNGKSLSGSGKQSVQLMASRMKDRFLRILKPDGSNAEEAMLQAIELETQLYNDAKPTDPSVPIENNPYSRVISSFLDVGGTRVNTYQYLAFNPVRDDNEASTINFLLKNKDKALQEYKNTEIKELSPVTIETLYRSKYLSEEDILNEVRIISPDKLTELRTVALNIADGKNFWEGDLEASVPENIRRLAKITGKSDVYWINKFLKKWTPEGEDVPQFSESTQDACIIREKDNKCVAKPSVLGANYIQAAYAQGVIPKSKSVEFYFGMNKEGAVDFGESYLESQGIDIDTLFNNTEDAKIFLDNGGLSKSDLSWDQLDGMFGLSNVYQYLHKGKLKHKFSDTGVPRKKVEPKSDYSYSNYGLNLKYIK
tara:strand:+ start:819 stop:3614 length:2796 start_codon:yes stop_codon:yes gene_type:complete